MRSGIIAKKVGMTRLFMEDGKQIPVTVLQMENLQVVAHAAATSTAIQLFNLAQVLQRRKTHPKRCVATLQSLLLSLCKVAEFRVDPENMLDVGSELTAEHYVEGQFADVSGTSIGKGFAGAMKRHNFGGHVHHTVFQSATAHMVQQVSVKAQVKCSKVRKWQATWVPFVSQHKTYRSLKRTQIVV